MGDDFISLVEEEEDPQPPKRLAASAKYAIELEANRAAREGKSRSEACRWPYDSAHGQHWVACYLLAGGKNP